MADIVDDRLPLPIQLRCRPQVSSPPSYSTFCVQFSACSDPHLGTTSDFLCISDSNTAALSCSTTHVIIAMSTLYVSVKAVCQHALSPLPGTVKLLVWRNPRDESHKACAPAGFFWLAAQGAALVSTSGRGGSSKGAAGGGSGCGAGAWLGSGAATPSLWLASPAGALPLRFLTCNNAVKA